MYNNSNSHKFYISNHNNSNSSKSNFTIKKESAINSLFCVESFLCNFQRSINAYKVYNFFKF